MAMRRSPCTTSTLGLALAYSAAWLPGALLGLWLGRLFTSVYARFYHFPSLAYVASPGTLLLAACGERGRRDRGGAAARPGGRAAPARRGDAPRAARRASRARGSSASGLRRLLSPRRAHGAAQT